MRRPVRWLATLAALLWGTSAVVADDWPQRATGIACCVIWSLFVFADWRYPPDRPRGTW